MIVFRLVRAREEEMVWEHQKKIEHRCTSLVCRIAGIGDILADYSQFCALLGYWGLL